MCVRSICTPPPSTLPFPSFRPSFLSLPPGLVLFSYPVSSPLMSLSFRSLSRSCLLLSTKRGNARDLMHLHCTTAPTTPWMEAQEVPNLESNVQVPSTDPQHVVPTSRVLSSEQPGGTVEEQPQMTFYPWDMVSN